MNTIRLRPALRSLIPLALMAVLIAGCAPSVKVRSDADPGVNMRQYQTYNFFSQMGVEGEGYSNGQYL
jgi:hypothetical protein